MSLLDTDKLEEISDIKIAIWDNEPTDYNIPIYSSLPKIDNMHKGQIIICNDHMFVLYDKSWVKIL